MTLAILPARGGSRRIPRKNLAPVEGVPLLAWAIRLVRESGAFDRVVVTTDDEDIARVARRWGAQVPFLRDAALADDHASTTEVLIDAVTRCGPWTESDVAACVYPTALLACPRQLAQAVAGMQDPDVDSVMTVTPFPVSPARAWRVTPEELLVPVDPVAMATRTQDLAPAWQDAGQWYVFRPASLLRTHDLLGSRCRPMMVPSMQAQDIDTPDDLELARWKHGRLRRWDRPRVDVLVRADCGPGVGTGHVMRCLALAEALVSRGQTVAMAMSEATAELAERVRDAGAHILEPADTVPGTWPQDAAWCLQHLPPPGRGPGWVIVDHYGLDARWHAAMRSAGARILVVDDLGDRDVDADLLLNQVPLTRVHAAAAARCARPARMLLGPRWTLLRREFREVPAGRKLRTGGGTAPRVLLFFGGEDAQGWTLQALATLLEDRAAFEPWVLVGHANPARDDVVTFCGARGVTCHVAHPRPSELLAQVDVVLCTCGMFALEARACGLPMVLVSVSDIQAEVADALAVEPSVRHRSTAALSDRALLPATLRHVLQAALEHPPETGFDAADRVVDLMLTPEPGP
jgi:N-acylneuraminate cytidylyltransferase